MVKKKIDNRIRVLIENGIRTFNRSLIVVVGDKGRDQVVILHHMLSKAQVKARPTVLWCYKKELDFSTFVTKLYYIKIDKNLFILVIVKNV
jgi:N-acetyltransferase 10